MCLTCSESKEPKFGVFLAAGWSFRIQSGEKTIFGAKGRQKWTGSRFWRQAHCEWSEKSNRHVPIQRFKWVCQKFVNFWKNSSVVASKRINITTSFFLYQGFCHCRMGNAGFLESDCSSVRKTHVSLPRESCLPRTWGRKPRPQFCTICPLTVCQSGVAAQLSIPKEWNASKHMHSPPLAFNLNCEKNETFS